MYEVLKPLPDDARVLQPGEVVDASGWRNLRSLIAGRYLKPVEVKAVKPSPVSQVPVEEAAPKPRAKRTPTSTSEE